MHPRPLSQSTALDRNSKAIAMSATLAVVSLALTGCLGPEPRLVIVARSDLVPYEEVDRIDVELVGVGSTTSASVSATTALREGLTVYDRRLATLRARHVRVTFFFDGSAIATRDLVFDHMEDRELTVLVPRLCVDAACSDGETCVLGQCAAWTCVDGDEADCPEAMCADDGVCAIDDVACATGACSDGVCVGYGEGDGCADGEWCDPRAGCVVRRALVDAWAADPDTGIDAAEDGGLDPGMDADTADTAPDDVDAAVMGI
jgi:hypothetical protein